MVQVDSYRKLSILIPVYNEEYFVGQLVEKVLEAPDLSPRLDLTSVKFPRLPLLPGPPAKKPPYGGATPLLAFPRKNTARVCLLLRLPHTPGETRQPAAPATAEPTVVSFANGRPDERRFLEPRLASPAPDLRLRQGAPI